MRVCVCLSVCLSICLLFIILGRRPFPYGLWYAHSGVVVFHYPSRRQKDTRRCPYCYGSILGPSYSRHLILYPREYNISVRSSIWSFDVLCIFIFLLISSVGVQRHYAFIPTIGSSQAYMSVCLSVRLSVYLPFIPVIRIAFWRPSLQPVIARSVYGRRP